MEFVMHAQNYKMGIFLVAEALQKLIKVQTPKNIFWYLRWGVGDGLEETGSCAEQRTSEDLVLRPGPAPRGRTNIKWTM